MHFPPPLLLSVSRFSLFQFAVDAQMCECIGKNTRLREFRPRDHKRDTSRFSSTLYPEKCMHVCNFALCISTLAVHAKCYKYTYQRCSDQLPNSQCREGTFPLVCRWRHLPSGNRPPSLVKAPSGRGRLGEAIRPKQLQANVRVVVDGTKMRQTQKLLLTKLRSFAAEPHSTVLFCSSFKRRHLPAFSWSFDVCHFARTSAKERKAAASLALYCR